MIPHRPIPIKSKKALSKLYDALYRRASDLFREYDPCKIRHMAGGEVSCIAHSTRNLKTTCCCGYCKWLGPNGCRVKALYCKVWICSTLSGENPKLERQLRHLSAILEKEPCYSHLSVISVKMTSKPHLFAGLLLVISVVTANPGKHLMCRRVSKSQRTYPVGSQEMTNDS
jgi:hypothetical protein